MPDMTEHNTPASPSLPPLAQSLILTTPAQPVPNVQGPHAQAGSGVEQNQQQVWEDVEAIRLLVSERLSSDPEILTSDSEQQRHQRARAIISRVISETKSSLLATEGEISKWDNEYTHQIAQAVFDAIFRLGRLQPLVDNPEIDNIHIHGYDEVFAEFTDGTRRRMPPIAGSDQELMEMIRHISESQGEASRPFSTANPDLDLDIMGYIRLAAVAPPIAQRPTVILRIHRYIDITLDDLENLNTLTREVRDFLTAAITARKSIVVAGDPGDGKTTLMRALAAVIDPTEQIVTIEKERELHLNDQRHRVLPVIEMQYRPGTGEKDAAGHNVGEYTLKQCVEKALRLNSSHIMVGEVRGSEISSLIEAMQIAGGTFCTVHAYSPEKAIDRLAGLAMADGYTYDYASRQLADSLDFIVQMKKIRDPYSGQIVRKVTHVSEVLAGEGGRQVSVNNIFEMPEGWADPVFRSAPTNPKTLSDLHHIGWQAPLQGVYSS